MKVTIHMPKIRPRTISMRRAGFVTTVCSERIRMSSGSAQQLRKNTIRQQQPRNRLQDESNVNPDLQLSPLVGIRQEPAGKHQQHREHCEDQQGFAANRFLQRQIRQRQDTPRRQRADVCRGKLTRPFVKIR
jgi:hypothetical protein